jgi:Rrf2 family protein
MITNREKERSAVMASNSQFAVAIHILAMLSLKKDVPMTSEYMGGSVNTNPVFIRRILGLLSRAGLVVSHPGVGGGWRLLRAPEAITLLDVYRAVDEGHLLAHPHSEPNPECLVGRNIQRTLKHYFSEAELAFEQSLARHTIADVLATIGEDPHMRL